MWVILIMVSIIIVTTFIITFPVPILVRLNRSMCWSKGVHLHFLRSQSLSSSTETLGQNSFYVIIHFYVSFQSFTCLTLLKTLSRFWKVAKSTMESIPNWSLFQIYIDHFYPPPLSCFQWYCSLQGKHSGISWHCISKPASSLGFTQFFFV